MLLAARLPPHGSANKPDCRGRERNGGVVRSMQPSSVVKAASHPRLQHELETRMGSVRDSSERTC